MGKNKLNPVHKEKRRTFNNSEYNFRLKINLDKSFKP